MYEDLGCLPELDAYIYCLAQLPDVCDFADGCSESYYALADCVTQP
ncbi:MAG: hypothetical protein R3B70_37270 [Polyangiaceae bacterium]